MDNFTDLPKIAICSSDIDSETLEAIRILSSLAATAALTAIVGWVRSWRRRRPREETEMSSKIMLPFIHPFTAIVAGPTRYGKTRFVFILIDNASSLISPPPANTVYFYGEYKQFFNQYSHTKFHQGLPNIED